MDEEDRLELARWERKEIHRNKLRDKVKMLGLKQSQNPTIEALDKEIENISIVRS